MSIVQCWNWTALQEASANGHPAAVQFLLSAGANPEAAASGVIYNMIPTPLENYGDCVQTSM